MNFKSSTLLLVLVFLGVLSWVGVNAWQEPKIRGRKTTKQTSQIEKLTSNQPIILAKTNSTKCVMLKKTCDIDLLIRKDVDSSSLIFKSNSEKIFVIHSIEPCNAGDALDSVNKCLGLNDFNVSFDENKLKADDYSVSRIKLKAVLIGNATLSAHVKGKTPEDTKEILTHKILVTAPRRPIDIIFDIWRWSFGSIISLCKLREKINYTKFRLFIYDSN
jgi:hypothetical protein